MPDEVDLTLVTMVFDAAAADEALAVLSKYVVMSRGHPGCRNIDLTASVTTPGRYVVIEKWETPAAQRAHFDSDDMVEMARACAGLLTGPPQVDLLVAIERAGPRVNLAPASWGPRFSRARRGACR